jgi:DNA-binding response OmpR family regulator
MMRKILAVDDDNDILEVLRFVLEDSGYEVETLSDGRYLFDKIKSNSPDLILLDIMLGNLDGTHDIPVILISASHNIADSITRKGAPNAFIAKPFDIDVLLNTIQTHLRAA